MTENRSGETAQVKGYLISRVGWNTSARAQGHGKAHSSLAHPGSSEGENSSFVMARGS